MLKNQRDEVIRCPAKLVPFHLLCYANLKKYVFDHHFSFPVLSTKWNIVHINSSPHHMLDQTAKDYILASAVEQRGFFFFAQHPSSLMFVVEPLSIILSKEFTKEYKDNVPSPSP